MKLRNKAGPLIAVVALVCFAFVGAGCLQAYEYDPNSLEHAMQADRNVDDVNNGMDDAEIDAAIDEAWETSRALRPDATPEEVAVAKDKFYEGLRSYAVTDIEREIDKRQSEAWVEYEESKRPPDGEPPEPDEIGVVTPADE